MYNMGPYSSSSQAHSEGDDQTAHLCRRRCGPQLQRRRGSHDPKPRKIAVKLA